MRVSRSLFNQATYSAELENWIRSHGRSRTHVTSRKLCEESLNLIKHTLPKPGTCDIIDINPGICVWSKALHDVLKPRRHILVEKDRKSYAKYIEPLLQQPDSPYRYAPSFSFITDLQSGLLSSDPKTGVSEVQSATSQAKQTSVNNTLLITANLTSAAKKLLGFNGTEAKQFLNSYCRSLLSAGQYVHRNGLVRLLAWVDDSTRAVVIPSTVVGQTKQSIQLECACDISMVAGPSNYTSNTGFLRRWYAIDVENADDLVRTQNSANIAIAPDRQPNPPGPPIAYYPPTTEVLAQNRHKFPEHAYFIEELLSVENRIATGDPAWLRRHLANLKRRQSRDNPQGRDRGGPTHDLDKKLYCRLMNQLRTYHTNFVKIQDIINQFQTLWRRNISLSQDAKMTTNFLADLSDFEARTKPLKRENRIIVDKAVDDYMAYKSMLQSMTWNRRTFEPLLVQRSEFYPHSRSLTLLDLRPRTSFPSMINTVDKQICFDYATTSFMAHKGDSILQAIQRIVPAGHEHFLEDLPELTDIDQGGWFDLEKARMRRLHWSFHVKIALAFEKWPHREPVERIMTGGQSLYEPVKKYRH